MGSYGNTQRQATNKRTFIILQPATPLEESQGKEN